MKAYDKDRDAQRSEYKKIYNSKRYTEKKKDPEFTSNLRILAKKNYHRRMKEDPGFIAKNALRLSFKNTLTCYLDGNKTCSVLDIVGCTTEEFIKHIEKPVCRRNDVDA